MSEKPGVVGPQSRSRLAYAMLREAIRRGQYKPGQRVREDAVATMLKMSRTPVREALRQLQTEGLVTHEPRCGMVLASLDDQKVAELYAMREALEGTAAQLAARHASDAELTVLEELLKEEAQIANDPAGCARHNRRFHLALHRAAHNRYLLQALNALGDAMMLLGNTKYTAPEGPRLALEQHRAIVDAIIARDVSAADAAARRHVQSALRYLSRVSATGAAA